MKNEITSISLNSTSVSFHTPDANYAQKLKEIRIHPSREELLVAFNSAETIEDGLEEVFRLGQKHWLAK